MVQMGEAPAGAASTLNCKIPVARVMWTSTVRFRVRDRVRVGVRVRVRVRCSFTVFSCGQRVDNVDTSLRLEPHLTRMV